MIALLTDIQNPIAYNYICVKIKVNVIKELIMKDDSAATPNPLNPSAASGTTPTSTQPAAAPSPAPTTEPTVTPIGEVTASKTTTATEPVDPTEVRPMEKLPTPTEPAESPKKKTSLIVGIIIGAVLLIGGITTAIVLILNQPKGDPVSSAILSLMQGNTPEKVAIGGKIAVSTSDRNSPITSVDVDFDSEAMTKSMLNSTKAKINVNVRGFGKISLDAEEIYAESGDLYFKVNGVSDLFDDYLQMMASATAGVDIEMLESMDAIKNARAIIDDLDGEWLRVSVEELTEYVKSASSSNSSKCMTELANDARNNANVVAKHYNENQFVTSSDENIPVESDRFPVYKIEVDSKVFSSFVNSVAKTDMMQNYLSCMDTEAEDVNESEVEGIISSLPDLYTEIDKDGRFARLYTDFSSGDYDIKADLKFSYPATINITEPSGYKNFSDALQQLSTLFYGF